MIRADHSCLRLCHIGEVGHDSPFKLVKHLAQAGHLGPAFVNNEVSLPKGKSGDGKNQMMPGEDV